MSRNCYRGHLQIWKVNYQTALCPNILPKVYGVEGTWQRNRTPWKLKLCLSHNTDFGHKVVLFWRDDMYLQGRNVCGKKFSRNIFSRFTHNDCNSRNLFSRMNLRNENESEHWVDAYKIKTQRFWPFLLVFSFTIFFHVFLSSDDDNPRRVN